MTDRIIEIADTAVHLSLENRLLKIRLPDGGEVSIPVSEIQCLAAGGLYEFIQYSLFLNSTSPNHRVASRSYGNNIAYFSNSTSPNTHTTAVRIIQNIAYFSNSTSPNVMTNAGIAEVNIAHFSNSTSPNYTVNRMSRINNIAYFLNSTSPNDLQLLKTRLYNIAYFSNSTSPYSTKSNIPLRKIQPAFQTLQSYRCRIFCLT